MTQCELLLIRWGCIVRQCCRISPIELSVAMQIVDLDAQVFAHRKNPINSSSGNKCMLKLRNVICIEGNQSHSFILLANKLILCLVLHFMSGSVFTSAHWCRLWLAQGRGYSWQCQHNIPQPQSRYACPTSMVFYNTFKSSPCWASLPESESYAEEIRLPMVWAQNACQVRMMSTNSHCLWWVLAKALAAAVLW